MKTGGLLPEPSNQVIVQSLQNLFKQNPICKYQEVLLMKHANYIPGGGVLLRVRGEVNVLRPDPSRVLPDSVECHPVSVENIVVSVEKSAVSVERNPVSVVHNLLSVVNDLVDESDYTIINF